MKKVYKAGIVGYGYMGQIRERVIKDNPDMELVGICDAKQSLQESEKKCSIYKDYAALIRDDVDIIFVCTPNCYTPDIIIHSLEKGKHVFAEKPPGRIAADIKRIREAELKKQDRKLMFGFNHRYHPGISEAKMLVERGDLGKILCIRGTYGKSGGEKFEQSWRNSLKIGGGGILLDQGIHMLDLMRYFCGEFNEVKGFVSNLFWKFEVEDNAFAIMKNRDNQIAMLHSSSTLWKHTFRLEIFLEKGYLIISGLLSKTGSYGREMLTIGKRQFESESFALGNPREEIIYFDQDRSWDLEVEYFLDCVKENKPITNSSSYDALKVMELVEEIYKDSNICYGDKLKEEIVR